MTGRLLPLPPLPPPCEPVTAYRVGWAPHVYRALRMPLVLKHPVFRREVSSPWWRWLGRDMRAQLRKAAASISRDGLVPPWQAEIQAGACTCNARRGWTRRQAITRVVAEHNTQADLRRCGDSDLRLVVTADGVEIR